MTTLDTHGRPQLPDNLPPTEDDTATGRPTGPKPFPWLRETITIGPSLITFCNTNTKMGLKGHCHTAQAWVTYRTTGDLGYPSFQATNQALRDKLQDLTAKPFRDFTNEDVTRSLFNALDGWTSPAWRSWGGAYQLHAFRLDVIGVQDTIGHDPGLTTYTVERPW